MIVVPIQSMVISGQHIDIYAPVVLSEVEIQEYEEVEYVE